MFRGKSERAAPAVVQYSKRDAQENLGALKTSRSSRLRTRPQLSWFLLLYVAVLQPLRDKIPSLVTILFTISASFYLGYSLLVFRRWGDEIKYLKRFLICISILVLELLIEWELIWLASALDERKDSAVLGLQDNVERVIRAASDSSAWAGAFFRWRWMETLPFLFAFLAVAVSPLWDQVPYSGFGIASRMTLTMALSRLIRCACFMSTILPNPRPGCYRRKYPRLPDSAWEVLLVPWMRKLSFSGGCNDLIFSGHCGAWALTPLVIQTYYPGHRGCVLLMWVSLAQTAARDVLERFHYSVDMILAVLCVSAVWTWLAPVYPETEMVPERRRASPPDRVSPGLLLVVAASVCFGPAVVIAFGG